MVDDGYKVRDGWVTGDCLLTQPAHASIHQSSFSILTGLENVYWLNYNNGNSNRHGNA